MRENTAVLRMCVGHHIPLYIIFRPVARPGADKDTFLSSLFTDQEAVHLHEAARGPGQQFVLRVQLKN